MNRFIQFSGQDFHFRFNITYFIFNLHLPIIEKSSDIWTTILVQPLRQPCYSLFSLVKNNREREKKEERIKT